MKYRVPKNLQKKKEARQFWRIFLIEGALFLLASLLAILGAYKLNILVQERKVYLPTVSLQDFFFSFLFITFFILLFVSVKKAGKFKELIYKGFFILTVFWGGMTILTLKLPVLAAVLIMGALIIWWVEKPIVAVHNALMVLGMAGAASFFGLGFQPSVVVILLLVFSFYDFIAVYKTKHMITMAKDMVEQKVILGFIIPKEIKYFKEKLAQVKPKSNFFILGGGDVVFPNLLAVSVVPSGFLKALVVVVFSLAGSFLSYWIFANQKEKEPIPALPPVALFAIIGYFITLMLP